MHKKSSFPSSLLKGSLLVGVLVVWYALDPGLTCLHVLQAVNIILLLILCFMEGFDDESLDLLSSSRTPRPSRTPRSSSTSSSSSIPRSSDTPRSSNTKDGELGDLEGTGSGMVDSSKAGLNHSVADHLQISYEEQDYDFTDTVFFHPLQGYGVTVSDRVALPPRLVMVVEYSVLNYALSKFLDVVGPWRQPPLIVIYSMDYGFQFSFTPTPNMTLARVRRICREKERKGFVSHLVDYYVGGSPAYQALLVAWKELQRRSGMIILLQGKKELPVDAVDVLVHRCSRIPIGFLSIPSRLVGPVNQNFFSASKVTDLVEIYTKLAFQVAIEIQGISSIQSSYMLTSTQITLVSKMRGDPDQANPEYFVSIAFIDPWGFLVSRELLLVDLPDDGVVASDSVPSVDHEPSDSCFAKRA